jgi:pimeloyl-ACP methyl ester carboxylesterase
MNIQRQKLFLLGVSWGSVLGLLVVRRRPDLFEKMLFRGMCTVSEKSERMSMEFVLKRIAEMKFSQENLSDVNALGNNYSYSYAHLPSILLLFLGYAESLSGVETRFLIFRI